MGIPVNIPNESTFKSTKGDPGSSASLAMHATPYNPPNEGSLKSMTGNAGSSFPLGRHPSPVNPPNADHRFKLADATPQWPVSAMQPGVGMVPIDVNASGGAKSAPMPVSAFGKAK